MILCRFLKTWGTHHANDGSFSILFIVAYSASSIGYESLRSFKAIQSVDPSFHRTHISQPLVVRFFLVVPALVRNVPSLMGIASYRVR